MDFPPAGPCTSWWRSADFDGSATSLDPVATPPVRYANRDGDAEVRHAAMAGYYYVVVKLSPLWTEGAAVPDLRPTVEIAVNVIGEAVAGPDYAEAGVGPLAEPAPPTVSSEPVRRAAAEPETPRSSMWWLIGWAVLTVLVAMALILVLRRRTARTRRPDVDGGHVPNPPR